MRTKLSTGVTLLIAAGLSGALMLSALPASADNMGPNATGRSAVEVLSMIPGSAENASGALPTPESVLRQTF